MFRKYTAIVILAAVMLTALALSLSHIGWGTPSLERTMLVFGDERAILERSADLLAQREKGYQTYLKENFANGYTAPAKGEDGTVRPVPREAILAGMRWFLQAPSTEDEMQVLSAFSRMDPQRFDFNPRFFTYGGSYLYPLGFFCVLGKMAGFVTLTNDLTYYFLHPSETAKIYTLIRLFNIIFLAGSLVVLYLIGSLMYGNASRALAALFFSLTPALVVYSHIGKPYVAATFFGLVSLFFSLKIMAEHRRPWHYYLSALFAGFSMGAVLPNGIMIVPLLMAHVMANGPSWKRLFDAVVLKSLAVFAAAYALTNPFVVASPREYLNFLAFERQAYNYGLINLPASLAFLGDLVAVYFNKAALPLVAISLFIAGRRRQPLARLVLWSFGIALVMFAVFVKVSRVGFILLPFMAILSMVGAEYVLSRTRAPLGVVLVLCIAGFGFLNSAFHVGNFAHSTTLEAGRWINETIPRGTRIGLKDGHLIAPYSSPAIRYLDYRLYHMPGDFARWGTSLPDYFLWGGEKAPFPASSDFWRHYSLLREFRRNDRIAGIRFRPVSLIADTNYPLQVYGKNGARQP